MILESFESNEPQAPLRPAIVTRDLQGNWCHPQLPKWSENTSSLEMEEWTRKMALHSKIVHIGNRFTSDIVERWLNGENQEGPEWPLSYIKKGYIVLSVSQIDDDIMVWLARSVRKVDQAA